MTDDQKLFANRLAFITCHREKRVTMPGLELFYGQTSFFRNAFLFDEKMIGKVPANFQLHVPDWVKIDSAYLQSGGWHFSETMKYMGLKKKPVNPVINPALTIEKIAREKDLESYCRVQSLGFNGEGQPDDELFSIMLASSRKNFEQGHHHFYLASLENEPVGVTVSFLHDNIAGIYSVTTLPAYRNRGVSTTLMATAIAEMLQLGAEQVTLQVMAGSYAESFYWRLGFKTAFACQIYVQPSFLSIK